MKIVIMQMDSAVPDNATWTCFKPPDDTPDIAWEMQGHKVIDLPEDEAKALLQRAADALQLQFTLRDLMYPPTPKEEPKP